MRFRKIFAAIAVALPLLSPLSAYAQSGAQSDAPPDALKGTEAVLYKTPECGCCDGHADYLRAAGINHTLVIDANGYGQNASTVITQGQTLLIIEAMKTMNHIPAPRSGVVKEILIENGQPVGSGGSWEAGVDGGAVPADAPSDAAGSAATN